MKIALYSNTHLYFWRELPIALKSEHHFCKFHETTEQLSSSCIFWGSMDYANSRDDLALEGGE